MRRRKGRKARRRRNAYRRDKVPKKWVRKERNSHHIIPETRGGSKVLENQFIMWNDRHEAWHMLFGEMTLNEIIELLQRIKHAKLVL